MAWFSVWIDEVLFTVLFLHVGRFQFRAVLADHDGIDGKFLSLASYDQLESLGQERLQHSTDTLGLNGGRRPCWKNPLRSHSFDIVLSEANGCIELWSGRQPGGSNRHSIRLCDQPPKRDGCCGNPSAREEAHADAARICGSAFFDGRRFESDRWRGLRLSFNLRGARNADQNRQRSRCPEQQLSGRCQRLEYFVLHDLLDLKP